MRNAEGDSTKIANVFLQNDSGFSVYHEYCQNYPRTMDVIGELTRDEKMVPVFREKQMALGHPLPLGSYLLKPVQRILKYHLLLQVKFFITSLSIICSLTKSSKDKSPSVVTNQASSLTRIFLLTEAFEAVRAGAQARG